MGNIIGVGDNVCDKYRHLGMMYPGGQAYNVAANCRLEGWPAAYIGSFGNDAVAQHLIATAEKLGLDISRARHYEGENAYAIVDLKDGERIFVGSNKGGVSRLNPLRFTQEELDYIASFAAVHTSNDGRIEDLASVSSLPNYFSYDFSYTWKDEERTAGVCPHLDFGFLSCAELSDEDVEAQVRKMHAYGCRIVIATMGSRGAVAFDGTIMQYHRPEAVKPLDTLGAGDAMTAGFLMHFLTEKENAPADQRFTVTPELLYDCLASGARLAAKCCLVYGAFGMGAEIVE